MLTVSEICDQYAWLYTKLPVPMGTWDHVIPVDGAYVAIKRVDDTDYVCFRGSLTFLDWIEDFQNLAVPYDDIVLGPVHPGARNGVLMVKQRLDLILGDKVVIVGHSLGAMHAAIYAGYRLAGGFPVECLVLFGEPKSGGPKLSKTILDKSLCYSYKNQDKNGHDLVTDVPLTVPGAPYQHVSSLLPVTAHPLPDDIWLAFRYHHFGLYCKALNAVSSQALSLPLKG